MNTKNIHFKIVLSFSLFLSIATGIIFTSFYVATNHIFFQEVDKELLLHSHNPTQFNNIAGMVITVLDQNGGIKNSSISYDTPYVSYKYLFETAKNNLFISYINQNIGNTPMRFLVKPIIVNEKLYEVLLIAHPIQAIQKSLNLLLYSLGTIFIILIIPTILGVRLLAIKLIKPISTIADKMGNITSENLDERLINPKSKDEIEKLTVTFNNLLDRLQQSFYRERQFIGDIAHELKTPIATLKSGVEVVLSRDRQKNEYKETLKETLIDVDRMSSLVKNILDLAWIGASHDAIRNGGVKNTKSFNLSDLVEELKEIALKLGKNKKIIIKSNIQPGIIIIGDEGKITRAILNIIDNAIKYTSNKKPVSISLRKSLSDVIIEIKNNGIGISKKDLSHVFERFYRGSKTAKTLGSGLGLAISQGIINAHKGQIKIDSQKGSGTTVKITLPL